MENIINIIDQYKKIQNCLDRIEMEIKKSDFANDPDYKQPAVHFFLSMQLMVQGARAYLDTYLSNIIEAEVECDPDLADIERRINRINDFTRRIQGGNP